MIIFSNASYYYIKFLDKVQGYFTKKIWVVLPIKLIEF